MRAIRVLAPVRARSRIMSQRRGWHVLAPRASGDARQMRSYCLSRAVGTFRAPRMGRRARRRQAPPRCSSPPYVSMARMARPAPRAWGDAPGSSRPASDLRRPIGGSRLRPHSAKDFDAGPCCFGVSRRLLGLFAHPDDESFLCGGTLARYARPG